MKLPPKQTVSQWADVNRKLSSESSAEVGDWNTSRAEYQRGIMDAVSDIDTIELTIMASAQVGKTEIINNTVGYYIDKDPAPILLLQPSLDVAESWSKDRLDPMLRDTPCLRGKISNTKDSGNTVRHKTFPGGHITMAGANSAASLSSRPIRLLLLDEIDRYPFSAGKEGDPVELAIARTKTFWNRKIIKCSTPTIKNASKIEASFEESDKRYFYVPCPHCGRFQRLRFSNVRWEKDRPETAAYICRFCGSLWNDVERWNAVSKGRWHATRPFKGHAGFFIWEGYSPWVTLADIADRFLKAKKDPSKLKTFTNTVLGESWEEIGERVDEGVLYDRREDYIIAPSEVCVITAGVDVQANRLEVDRFGWSANNQCWGLGKRVIYGDPTGTDVWNELDDILKQPVPHAIAGEMSIKACCVDCGYLTQKVGNFCKERWGRKIWATKGVAGEGRPIMKSAPGKLKKLNLPFFHIGVDTAKDTIYARLKIDDPSKSGYIHFNKSYDKAHFEQLTAEEIQTKYHQGKKTRLWTLKPGHLRNEALDLMVYAMAALEGLRLSGLSLRQQTRKLEAMKKYKENCEEIQTEHPEVGETQLPPPPPILHKRRRRRIVGRMV